LWCWRWISFYVHNDEFSGLITAVKFHVKCICIYCPQGGSWIMDAAVLNYELLQWVCCSVVKSSVPAEVSPAFYVIYCYFFLWMVIPKLTLIMLFVKLCIDFWSITIFLCL
jgi:hypothetical protein